jgi:asparagine synthase (glutamine-hydrolysing)
MLHEPFYSHGSYALPECGFYFGWVSHPDAFVNWNPVVSSGKDKILIFSGEHFDHDRGCPQPGKKTGEHLLKLFEAKGDRFLLDLNGWFAGLLIDLPRKTVLLFNDRFGLHRVYYHQDRESFTFASEAKALLSIHPETREFDTQSVGEFLAVGTALQNRTIFSKILILPGGSSWAFKSGVTPVKRQYFERSVWEQQPVLPAETFYDRLHSTMSRLLPTYFCPAEKVGLSLTGGLDTRMIVAGRPPSVKPGACYTYGGVYRRCFDVQVAQEIATASGNPHHIIPLENDFFQRFSTFADETVWMTDGSLDIFGAHELYFSRRARQLAPIRLTGNYGSEIMRSASTFKYLPPPQTLLDGEFRQSLKQAQSTFNEICAVHSVSFAAFSQIPWQLFGRLAAAQTQLIVRAPYTDNDLVALMYQAPPELRRSKDAALRLISDLSPALAAIKTDMGDGGNGLAIARSVRKTYRYLLFKAEWYYSGGMPNWLTRFDHNPLARQLEATFVGSHKIEHYRLWFRDQLFDYVSDMLNDRQTSSRPYLNRDQYKLLVRAHTTRTGNYMNEINKLLTLELIQRSLLDANHHRARAGRPLHLNQQEKVCR